MATKIYISMTSTIARRGTLGPTLESLRAQTVRADEIRLHGEPSVITDSALDPFIADGTIKTAVARDRGPVTKLAILEDRKLRDDDILITVDDDIIYEPRWLETLLEGAAKHPDHAVGFCGWNAYDFLRAAKDNDPKGGEYVWAAVPGPCDVLEGWAGIAYRRKFFYIDPLQGIPSVLCPLPMFRNVDDVWIAWHLHRRRVPRATIHHRMARERPDPIPGLHHLEDFVDLNRKAAIVAFGDHEWSP